MPVQQGFDWAHGIIAYGACSRRETTSATLGKEGVPEFNLMSILDFVAIPLGKYIPNNLDFAKRPEEAAAGLRRQLLPARPRTASYLNGKRDKDVWVEVDGTARPRRGRRHPRPRPA